MDCTHSASPHLFTDFIGSCTSMLSAVADSDRRHLFHKRHEPVDQAVPASPPPPPTTTNDTTTYDAAEAEKILSTATHVLATEAAGLLSLSRLYTRDPICRNGFVRAVQAIAASQEAGGKTIVVGVGKSGKIGDKLVASMNSMGLFTVFLNPVDALHGDLGIIRKNDVLLLITFSGKTPELLQLLPHLPAELPLIAMTSHTSYHTSPLTRGRENAILLPAPIHESEIASFGLSAPTTSTTVAMALGDALALSAANQIHNTPGLGPKEVFKKNHPGGAIGQVNLAESQPDAGRIRELAVRWDEMLPVEPSNQSTGLPTPAMSETSSESDLDLVEWNCPPSAADIAADDGDSIKGLTVLDCLRLAVKSPKGWLLARSGGVIPPKRLQSCENVMINALAPGFGIVVDLNEQLCVQAEMDTEEVARMLSSRKALNEVTDDTVIALIDSGKIVGAVEVGTVLEHVAY